MFEQVLDRIGRAASAHELKLRVMDDVAAPFGAGATGLYLFGPDGTVEELHTRGVRDGFTLAYEQLGRGHDPILERVLASRTVAHDGTVYRGDDWTRSELYRTCGGPWQIKHYLCAPIVDGDSVIGTLNLGRRSAAHPFTPRDVASIRAVADAVASRLHALARRPANDQVHGASFEALGRLSAERTRIRLEVAALEARAEPLPAGEAEALWDAVASRHVTPLDYFDEGDRTYMLLPISEPPAPVALTPRESEVVRCVAAGLATKVIASELGLSQHAVYGALASLRGKLGAGSRVKLVEVARRLGLV